MGTFDGFQIKAGVFYESRSPRGERKRRALALMLSQPPKRSNSQNDWVLHLIRLKEVELAVGLEVEIEVAVVAEVAEARTTHTIHLLVIVGDIVIIVVVTAIVTSPGVSECQYARVQVSSASLLPSSSQVQESVNASMSVVVHAFNRIHVVCTCLDIVGVACLFCCFLFDCV